MEQTSSKQLVEEDRVSGSVSFMVLLRFLRGLGHPLWTLSLLVYPVLTIIAYNAVRKIPLDWAQEFFNPENPHLEVEKIRKIAFWVVVTSLVALFKKWAVNMSITILGRKMHSKMTFNILHAKINEYIKRVPMGQFLNRFSNDIDKVDLNLGLVILNIFYSWPLVILDVYAIISGVQNFYLLIPCLVYILIGFFWRSEYMRAKREVFRLSAITKSPVVGLVTSCFNGSSQIRAMNCEEYLQRKTDALIEENSKNALMVACLDSWFFTKLAYGNLIFVLIPSYTVMLFTLYHSDPTGGEGKSNTAIAFFILQTCYFAGDFTLALRGACDMESQLISIERCRNFELIAPEQGYQTLSDDREIFEIPVNKNKVEKHFNNSSNRKKIIEEGQVTFNGVSARYPTSSKNVISGVNLTIKAGEKIGVVGRTGAGKSSLVKLLWRGMSPTQGSILIDGTDIQSSDLKTFRQNITWISQSSNLFEGTIESNLSITKMTRQDKNRVCDLLKELNFSLQKVDDELSFELEAEGSNLSEGEKQILSLVRGIYDKNRIVILDEISSFVDKKIESRFNRICKKEFEQSTVFTIAHRLDNVINCDKILVLEEGRVLEFDHPSVLLDNEESEFFKMWMIGR